MAFTPHSFINLANVQRISWVDLPSWGMSCSNISMPTLKLKKEIQTIEWYISSSHVNAFSCFTLLIFFICKHNPIMNSIVRMTSIGIVCCKLELSFSIIVRFLCNIYEDKEIDYALKRVTKRIYYMSPQGYVKKYFQMNTVWSIFESNQSINLWFMQIRLLILWKESLRVSEKFSPLIFLKSRPFNIFPGIA